MGEVTAYETYSAVEFTSPLKTRNEHLWKMSSFVPRALQLLHEVGSDDFLDGKAKREGMDELRVSSRKWQLTNSRLFIPMLRYVMRRFWLKVERRIFDERWILMYSTSGREEDMATYEMISPPPGRFWADPFCVRRNESTFIFFEDASTTTGLGRISVLRTEGDGAIGEPTTILDKPYHLSYPFIFEWNGVTYLVPESAENRTIELYRCLEFPYRWEFVHNLMENVSAYDATLFEYEGLWWMFVNVRQHIGSSTWDELCAFYSSSPISQEWQPHARNPIISDVRCARPAGRIFIKDGYLHRPSQDSSFRYGYALNVSRILKLTRTEYTEELVKRIKPDWSSSIRAVHTLNREDQLTVIDVIHRSMKLPFWNRQR